jgi:hypothetical protein
MTKRLPNKYVLPLAMPIPGSMGRAFRNGALLPASSVEVVGPRFSDWLSANKG